jgi:hypothetical protein
MKEETITYKDSKGCIIVAIFFDDKVQYKKEDAKYTKVVTYKKFLSILNNMRWVQCNLKK